MQFSRFHNIIKSNERIPKILVITKVSLRTLHSFINAYKNSFCALKPNLQRHTCGTHAYCMCNKTRLFCLYFFYFYKTARVENMQHTRKNGKRQKGHGGACIRLQGNQGLQARMQGGWGLLLCIHMRHKADKWQQKKIFVFYILGYETSDRAYTYVHLHWIYWNYRKYLEIRIYFFHHSKHYYFPHNHQLATQVRTHAHARLFCFIPFYNRNKPFNWRRMCVNNK